MDYLSTGVIAFLGIAIWDTARMLIQTWWLNRKLADQSSNCCCKYCPRCGSNMQGEGDAKDSCAD